MLIDTPGLQPSAAPQRDNRGGLSNTPAGGSRGQQSWTAGSAFEDTPGLPPMTGGSGTASPKQVTNAGSQFGNAWAEQRPFHPGQVPQTKWANVDAVATGGNQRAAICTRCGAIRCELGSEPLHDCAGWATGAPCGACFICHLVEVFAAVKRVLRPDGVCLVNLGDSYSGSHGNGYQQTLAGDGPNRSTGGTENVDLGRLNGRNDRAAGLKPKDLVGIPWRFALAMQAAGWWLRGDYIWSKPNPMPESVTDRCTRSHEYIFHFSKAPTYYWDSDAIRETSIAGHGNGQVRRAGNSQPAGRSAFDDRFTWEDDGQGRNARSVWEIATQATPLAHFATFPQALVRRAIRAGTSERGACAACGAPWARVVERGESTRDGPAAPGWRSPGSGWAPNAVARVGERLSRETVTWAPTCDHLDADVVPCRVLDIFNGSGTSMVVARQLGRYAIGVELSESYCEMALKRLRQAVLL